MPVVINKHDVGDLVRCSVTFTTTGTISDPDNVFGQWQDPQENMTTYQYGTDAALVRDSAGKYHFDINITKPGRFFYRFYSTGVGQAAEEHEFDVKRTEF